MASNDYHFITHWYVDGTIDEVAEILSDALSLTRWWPAVYLEIKELRPGDENGVGRVIDLYTKGWLPYTLRWTFRVTESTYPYGFSLEAWGDFNGRGIWTLTQEGPQVHVIYDWKIRADKPLLRMFSFLFKPIFAANHHWAMAKGEESLWLELARRRAKTTAERDSVPLPPGPTSARPFVLLLAAVIVGGVTLLLIRLRNRQKIGS